MLGCECDSLQGKGFSLALFCADSAVWTLNFEIHSALPFIPLCNVKFSFCNKKKPEKEKSKCWGKEKVLSRSTEGRIERICTMSIRVLQVFNMWGVASNPSTQTERQSTAEQAIREY